MSLSNYRILNQLNEDYEVYRAMDLINNRDVIIKKLRYDNDSIREVNNHSKVSHLSFIPSLHESLIIDESQYLVMELIEGESLYQSQLKNGNWNLNWIMLYHILIVIQELHNAGFYHGDLHFDNLLWNGKKLYLIDLDTMGDLTDMRSEDERRMDIRIVPNHWSECTTSEHHLIHQLRRDYRTIRTNNHNTNWKNDNHGLERYQLLSNFAKNLPHEDIDNGRYVTDNEYIRGVIDEYHRINVMIF